MSNELHIEKKYTLSKSFFRKFPTRQWDNMIADIQSDVDYPDANRKIVNFLTQLKPVFDGSQSYTIKVFKTSGRIFEDPAHVIATFNIEVHIDKQKVIEFDYFPMRSDGLPSAHKYYDFWIDVALISKKLLVKKLYHFNDDYHIEFVNSIFFNSSYIVDEVNERIMTNIKTRVTFDGELKSVSGVLYDFEALCHDVVNEPKKVAHAIYFKNMEVSYDDFIENEKDSHTLLSMINI